MSPEEIKAYVDIVVAFVSASGVSSIILAIIGAKKKTREDKAEDEKPSIGMAGMNALGSLLASENHLARLIQSIEALTLAYTTASERSRHEAEVQSRSMEDSRAVNRRFVEQLEDLNSTLKRLASRLPDRG